MSLKRTLKNIYFQIVIGIIIGTVLLLSVINKEGIVGLWGMLGVFFILVSIIRLIDSLNGKKTDLKSLIIGYVIYPILVGGFLVINNIGLEQLGNTINGSEIFKNFGISGLIFAFFVEFIRPKLFQTKEIKFSFLSLFVWIIIFPLLFISSASLFNKHKADLKTKSINSIVLKKKSKIDEKDKDESTYSIYTNIGNYNKELKIKPELWNNLQNNDSIILFLKKGYLGYDFIDAIEKKPTANMGYN